ncbi:hypothetical protein DCAR_0831819 [Daucus carota subsp. sativus]|uniref:Uncharacterized protein n=1 Tax=Daucus carota subsp. sativus TaxID=79200 RepID=A0A175YP66_DAUCS|nr:PREDICTED: zinc finger protein ZAT4-like [Daucus carota subsp. sativus]WOH12317.1 hypothetical protein DCAR_0831819 [Daucus carota subsp. sativus]
MAFIADAAMGSAISELLKVVIHVVKQTLHFKTDLKNLRKTLESVKLVSDELEKLHKVLDRPKEETERFIEQLTRGLELVHKCGAINKWNFPKQYTHSRKLVDLDKSIVKFFNIDVQGLVAVNTFKTLIGVTQNNDKLDRLLGYIENDTDSVFGADFELNSILDANGDELSGLGTVTVTDLAGGIVELKDDTWIATTLTEMPCHHPHIYQTRVFECKTCNKQFSTFQALGGHRTAHIKLIRHVRLNNLKDHVESSSANPRVHDQGPFSGPEFATGEALGGHMRRHRGGGGDNPTVNEKMNHHIPVVKKSRSRRIICLDVNVTPFEHDSIDWGSSNSSG